ncbi:hypothetical protein CCOS2040_30280 [Streptomyces albidoflavus]|nr:hypothetical protein CCOS2040_30280 [Streptomyces albidoflavus]
MTVTGASVLRTYATDKALLSRVLVPYKDHCRYLLTAEVSALPDGARGSRARSRSPSPATSRTPAI